MLVIKSGKTQQFILLNLVSEEAGPERSSGFSKATKQSTVAISGGPEVTWLCVASEICCEALVLPWRSCAALEAI